MDVFSVVEDAVAILLVRGVYKQVGIYSRGDKFFAKIAGGYVRLFKTGATSVPAIRWIDSEGFTFP